MTIVEGSNNLTENVPLLPYTLGVEALNLSSVYVICVTMTYIKL